MFVLMTIIPDSANMSHQFSPRILVLDIYETKPGLPVIFLRHRICPELSARRAALIFTELSIPACTARELHVA